MKRQNYYQNKFVCYLLSLIARRIKDLQIILPQSLASAESLLIETPYTVED